MKPADDQHHRMRRDIELVKNMGFSGVHRHLKKVKKIPFILGGMYPGAAAGLERCPAPIGPPKRWSGLHEWTGVIERDVSRVYCGMGAFN